MTDIIEIKQADMLQAINRAEIDIQIATAKAYPRDLARVLNQIETYATMDTETAEDCFYALRRGRNEGGDNAVIEGVSVRLAEIIASAWGNMRVQARIIGNDGRTITCQGVCHDLETNLAVSVEVKRRITNKNGQTFSEDMQVVTGNAGSAIAFRNAVLKVVPKAVTKKVINNIKQVALGKSIDLETSRQRMIEYYAKIGVTEAQMLEYLEIKKIDQIDKELIFELRALANAIKEGTTTVAETFKKNVADSDKTAEELRKKAEALQGKIQNAQKSATETTKEDDKPTQPVTDKKATAATKTTEKVDKKTGEIFNQ